MSWPTAQDYNEAIQNPGVAFADTELRSGRVQLTALGLPKPNSGAFATVYQMHCGSRSWAVRCFSKGIADQQRRYQEISKHLSAARLPFMVGFEFLANGIKVQGKWHPILKMEWVDGVTLNEYIRTNVARPAALQSLLQEWVGVLRALKDSNIAHGDLQHGNVLVSGGKVKLIDYDGMFVPSMTGWQSHEEGHRNYQHPLRTGRDFGPILMLLLAGSCSRH